MLVDASSRADDNYKSLIILGLAVVVAICLNSSSLGASVTGALGMIVLIALAWMRPWLAILTVMPLTFGFPSTPQALGWREVLYALLCAVLCLRAMWDISRKPGKYLALKIFRKFISIYFFVFTLNFLAAVSNDVDFFDWLRGCTPYIFLLMIVPVATYSSAKPSRVFWLLGSCGVLVSLISAEILIYYLAHRMWVPYWIVDQGGQVIKVNSTAIPSYIHASGPFLERITLYIHRSTDGLLPVGAMFGIVTVIFHRSRLTPLLLVFSSLVILTMVLTYTRSTLLTIFCVQLMLVVFVYFFSRQYFHRLISVLCVTTGITLCLIYASGSQSIWIGRLEALAATATDRAIQLIRQPAKVELATLDKRSATFENQYGQDTKADGWSLSNAEDGQFGELRDYISGPQLSEESTQNINQDVNVNYRFNEYVIAWKKFVSSPVLGEGLGTQVQMTVTDSAGRAKTYSKGYLHNWVFYFLMTGGVLGFVSYSILLLGPLFIYKAEGQVGILSRHLIFSASLTMAIYCLFFPSFRLIDFNLFVAVIWGLVLSQRLYTIRSNFV